MNLKALITTLVLGSSSVAMAKPTTLYSTDAKVSVGFRGSYGYENRPVVIDHRHPLPPIADDGCDHGSFWNPNNTTVGANVSVYVGPKFLGRTETRWGRPSWMAITEPTRIDSGREFIALGGEGGRFQQLKLQSVVGTSTITQVAIEFSRGYGGSNGATQVVKINRTLSGNGSFTIDLAGGARHINRIVVYGSTSNGSAYQVLGL